MLCAGLDAAVNEDVLQEAVALLVPAVRATELQPEMLTPSLVKATVPPEGTLEPEVLVMVAFSVTEESTVDGLLLEETTTLVAERLTVWEKFALVAAA